MYRARAEKVSGKKVYAGGKWLICIGNKPVSVGDLIFTDGRCVYGFYQESQQPMVISQKKIIGAIPLITQNWRNQCLYYTYRNGNLQEITLRDENGKEIKDTKTVLMINSYKDKVFVEKNLFDRKPILAANVDKQGNLYRMINFKDERGIAIFKNEEMVKTISDEIYSQDDTIAWAFIENENDWAYILGKTIETVNIASESEWITYRYSAGEWLYPINTIYNGNAYFYNSAGACKNIAQWSGDLLSYGTHSPQAWGDIVPYFDLSLAKSNEILNCQDIKFPMQDGYYFTMSNMYPMPITIGGAPWIATKNIYSPTDKLIFSGVFPVSSYLTIYKNLIGVKDNDYLSKAVYQALEPRESWQPPENLIDSGVYQLVDGNLKPVLADENYYYSFLNQRLRPMTGYKNWTDNLQEFTFTEE